MHVRAAKSVLLVDEDAAFARALGLALTAAGFNAHISSSTEESLETIRIREFDVVIAVDEMSEITGAAFLTEVRVLRPGAKRILMSSAPNDQAAIASVDDGVYRYVAKPLPVEKMTALVKEALAPPHDSPAPAIEQPSRADAVKAERRRQLLASLNEAYPGLLTVPAGAYLPMAGSDFVLFRKVAREALTSTAGEVDNRLLQERAESFDPLRLADDLLVFATRMPATTISIEPSPDLHTISIDSGARSVALVTLSSALGDSVAARLALLARLDLAAVGHQAGTLVVEYDSVEHEIGIALRTSALGLGVELRRDAAPVAGATPTSPRPRLTARDNHADSVPGYRLLERLGEGGVGIVYRAVHLVLETAVAIKLLLPSEAALPASSARMLREARAASRSKHPGIVAVLDCGRLPDQRAYIIMELVDAPTLDKVLEQEPALPIDEAVRIARRVAEALEAAHGVGVVHRDIKPSNIFVSATEDMVKLTDFGAAMVIDDAGPSLTSEAMAVGTPHYMSPEQARGHRVDRRADIYALGCVLYEMLCGKTPFVGKDAIDVIAQHVLAPVPMPVSPLSPLPLALTRTIQRALAKNPNERHQTARELIGDLESATASVKRTGWRRWLP